MARPIDREVTSRACLSRRLPGGHPFDAEIDAEPAVVTPSAHPVNGSSSMRSPTGYDLPTPSLRSWAVEFIVVQTIIVCVWLVANVIVLIRPFNLIRSSC